MLPIFINDELDIREGDTSHTALLETVRGKLKHLTGQPQSLRKELVAVLMEKKHILVIVDNLSGMSDATRLCIQPQRAEFPGAALIVTSRLKEEKLETAATFETVLLTGNRVSQFVQSYIEIQGKSGLFDTDQEFHSNCNKLSQIAGTGERKITPMFAKLFLDHLINAKDSGSRQPLPDNIPDLVLRYVDNLNPNDAAVNKRQQSLEDAQTVAGLCVKKSFTPIAVSKSDIIKSLKDEDSEDSEDRFEYLKDVLGLLKVEKPREGSKYMVRFLLDPLAEYLAAYKVVNSYQGRTNLWTNLMTRIDNEESERVESFLLALNDCCRTTKVAIPEFVRLRLTEFQYNWEIKQLLHDLDSPDAITRRRACRRCGQIGHAIPAVISALCKSLQYDDHTVQIEAIRVLGAMGQRAESAIPDLTKLLQQNDTNVRKLVKEALELIASDEPTTSVSFPVRLEAWRRLPAATRRPKSRRPKSSKRKRAGGTP
jgi:hypothetical protein